MNETVILTLFIVYTVLLIVFGVILVLTIRQMGLINMRIGPVGSRATIDGPEIGSDQSKNEAILEILADKHKAGSNIIIAFVSFTCGTCKTLFPALKVIAKEQQKEFVVVVCAYEFSLAGAEYLQAQLNRHVLVRDAAVLTKEWSINGAPYCVVLDKDLIVRGKGITNTIEHLDSLVNTIEINSPTIEDYIVKKYSPELRETREEITN